MIRRRLRRLRELPAVERWRLAQAAAWLPVNAAGVRLVGLQRWRAFLERTAGPNGHPASGGLQAAMDTWRRVQFVARHGPYGGNCLSRSLTLWWLLRRQGVVSELRIGASKASGRFEAHAWIEYQGAVINDRPDVRERYGVFNLPAGTTVPFA
jgi:hypothetical protein